MNVAEGVRRAKLVPIFQQLASIERGHPLEGPRVSGTMGSGSAGGAGSCPTYTDGWVKGSLIASRLAARWGIRGLWNRSM